MKIILRADISTLGNQGDIKKVAPGYARNYLIPKKLAWEATEKNMKLWEKEKLKIEKQKEQVVQKAKELAERIEKISITIAKNVGEGGKLFGAVTNADIADVLRDNDIKIDKHNIILEEPIKEVGVYTVEVKVHPEVMAKPKVWVVEEKAEDESDDGSN